MAVSFCEIYHKVTNFVLWIFNIFLIFIIFVANYIKLDVRETLPGVLMDNQIILDKRIKSPIDDEIFIYKDKSQSVWKEKVLNVNTSNG